MAFVSGRKAPSCRIGRRSRLATQPRSGTSSERNVVGGHYASDEDRFRNHHEVCAQVSNEEHALSGRPVALGLDARAAPR